MIWSFEYLTCLRYASYTHQWQRIFHYLCNEVILSIMLIYVSSASIVETKVACWWCGAKFDLSFCLTHPGLTDESNIHIQASSEELAGWVMCLYLQPHGSGTQLAMSYICDWVNPKWIGEVGILHCSCGKSVGSRLWPTYTWSTLFGFSCVII